MKHSLTAESHFSLKELLNWSRPTNWYITVAPFLIGYFFNHHSIARIQLLIGILYFSFFYNLILYTLDDILQHKPNNKKSGKNSKQKLKQKSRFLIVLSIATNLPILALLIATGSLSSALTLLLLLLLTALFLIKPFRLKDIPILDSVGGGLLMLLILLFGLFYSGSTVASWPILVAFFSWGVGSYALNTIRKIKTNRAKKTHSTATWLRARHANTFSLLMYLISCAILIILYFPTGILVASILAVYPLNILFFKKFQSDAKSLEYQRAWNSFRWLNIISGFWLILFVIFIHNPLGAKDDRVVWFSAILLAAGFIQFILIVYNYRHFERPKTKRIGDLPHIDVIMHSAGDKENIASTLLALIGQNYPHFDIYYGNIDRNPQAQKIVESYEDTKLHIVNIPPSPHGWSSQVWASQCLLEKTHAEIVVSVSADTLLLPNTLSVIASQFENNDLDVISLLPADQNKSFWQQLIMSQEQFIRFGMYPAAFMAEHHPRLATTHSPLTAFKRKPIVKTGGFELTRNSPLEDLDIANKAKEVNMKTAFYTASDLAVSQNRSSYKDLSNYNKQRLYPSLNFNMPLSLALIGGGIATAVLPAFLIGWLLIIGQYDGIFILTIAYAVILMNRAIIALRSRQSIVGGLLFPLGLLFILFELFLSMLHYELFKPRWESRREL